MEYTPFLKWRYELANIQEKIDNFDEAFYDRVSNYNEAQIKEAEIDYKEDRSRLTAELEAHYKKEPNREDTF